MTAPSTAQDAVVAELRERIAELDRRVVALVNERLAVVAELRAHKLAVGLPLLDPEREEWLRIFLSRENAGPLSQRGLDELHAFVLALTKREAARG